MAGFMMSCWSTKKRLDHTFISTVKDFKFSHKVVSQTYVGGNSGVTLFLFAGKGDQLHKKLPGNIKILLAGIIQSVKGNTNQLTRLQTNQIEVTGKDSEQLRMEL